MMKRIIALLLALILTVGLLPTVALAADGENPTTDSGSVTKEASKDNLNLVKTVTKEGDNYKVTLESWATGTVTTTTETKPLDIVLLLDVSGSMDEKYSNETIDKYVPYDYSWHLFGGYNTTNSDLKKYEKTQYGVWYKLSDGTYVTVKVEVEERTWKKDIYTYSYASNGKTTIIERSLGANDPPTTQFYYKEAQNTTKLDALKTAVSAFIDNVATNSPNSNISIVKFADDRYKDTEGNDSYSNGYNYTQIVKKLTKVDTEGVTALKRAVSGLKAGGATASDYGLNKAAEALKDAKQERVVILFTDGEPNYHSGFDKEVATNAVNKAKELKTATTKTTIYTVGVFKNLYEDVNLYMSSVSSNYPNASAQYNNKKNTWTVSGGGSDFGKYYMNATNPVDLLKAFQTISSEVSGGELGAEAVLTDVIAPNFALVAPVGTIGVTAYTVDKTADGWSTQKTTLTNGVTVGTDGQVNVTGFDYSENCVTTTAKPNTTNDYGKKLVVEFTIHHNNYGGTQPTNAGASIKDKENKDVITVDNPSVPVTITEPSITGASENKIYDGEGINVIANIKAAADTLVTGANMGKNQFVTITVAVKVDKDTTYTYTIPAGEEFGSWGTTTPTLTTGKDVNTYEYDLTITYKDATLKTDTTTPAEPKTASAKATYTITPAQVTLTSETASKDYDGTALTKPEVTVGGAGATVFKNEVTDIKANGSVIDPGPAVTNAITYTPGANFKATNYNISKSEGKLSINDIAGPTNLPKVNVYCTNGVANHQESTGNTLKNNTYTSVVSKNAENKYICTITLTDKNSYIRDYDASTGATHTSDTTKTDFTKIILHYDTDAKAWPTPIVNFALNVKCDTPTVNVTYTWDGLDENDFDTVYLVPAEPDDATPNKGSDYTVDSRYNNSSIAIGKDGVRYKFSGWSSATEGVVIGENGKINGIQTNVTLTGHWTKLGSGTFDLTNKIFKSFTKADKSNDIPTAEGLTYNFEVKVTRQDDSTDVRYGSATLKGNETEATAFNFAPNHTLTFDKAGIYTYSVEENSGNVSPNGAVKGNIINDARKYQLTIKVDGNLDVEAYSFIEMPAGDTPTETVPTGELTITFENKYDEDPNADIVTLDLSKYVTKTFESRHGKSATETFEARVEIWVKNPEIIVTAAEENAIAVYDSDPVNGTVVYDEIGTVMLSTGEKASFTFATNPKLNRRYAYAIRVTEVTGNNTDVEYDKTVYESRFGFFYDTKEIQWLEGTSNFSFTNTYTGIDDYYPIIIPTIIGKDTGMLNKTDHFAYVIGYPDGTVHPNGQITRAEVATIFFRLLRDEVRDGAFTTSNTYSDVAYGKWYNNPISTMSALGIITGYPDGTFKPNKPITRAEFAAIAARFDETQAGKSATFSDVIGHWAAKEIGIAYYNDWIKGYPDGTFKPDQNITRAEAMTLINRVLERKPESPADLLTNMNKWTDNMDTSKWYYLDVQEATNSHGYTRKTFNYELWRQMLPDPDWSRYER